MALKKLSGRKRLTALRSREEGNLLMPPMSGSLKKNKTARWKKKGKKKEVKFRGRVEVRLSVEGGPWPLYQLEV